jgi:hypothetical protein
VEEVLSTGCTGGVCAFRLQLRSVIITPVWLAVRVDLHACMRSSAPHLLPRLACFLPDTTRIVHVCRCLYFTVS